MRLARSRGFTLLEILVVCGAAVVLALVCMGLTRAVLATFQKSGARFRDAAALARIAQVWLAEEDQAWAIFTPPNDVLGKANADGHEIDFFAHDALQQPVFWAYTFDAGAQTLTRFTYAAPNGLPQTPAVDQTFSGITSFSARTDAVTALATSPLYSSAVLHDAAVEFFPAQAPWIAGGNQITTVRISTGMRMREMHLSTQSAPSGYVVVLNYTPSPSASPSPGLSVWPPAIRFAAQGSGTLGGSSSCFAQAFTDSTFSTAIADGTRDPFGAGVTVSGPGGCYGGAVAVHEAGYAGAFNDWQAPSQACTNTEVAPGSWTPLNAAGPTASQQLAGSSQTTSGCTLGFSDSTSVKTATAFAQVIAPCWVVGGSCTFAMSYPDNQSPQCDPLTGETLSGYTGQGRAAISPSTAGTWTSSDGGVTYTFTRSAAGTVTVSVYAEYVRWSATKQQIGGYRCTSATTYPLMSTFTIPSV